MFDWSSQTVLITGGTGSFGRTAVRTLLSEYQAGKVIVYSRDELKQHEMRSSGFDDPRLRFFLGDVRDPRRLWRAFNDVTVVIHAAALKQVPACEYNPTEAVRTNVDGTANVIDACLDRGVARCMFISSDKAVDAATLYGSTKAVAEKLVVAANNYAGTMFAAARYGNVLGSRGSIVPLFQQQARYGRVTVTDPDATRFWLTLEQGVNFVLGATERMIGREVFIPDLGASTIRQIADVVAPGCAHDVIGLRAGEKQHEALVSPHEVERTYAVEDGFVVYAPGEGVYPGVRVAPSFTYTSASTYQLGDDELAGLVAVACAAAGGAG